MLCYEGKLSLKSFGGTIGLILSLSLPELFFEFVPKIWGSMFWGPILYYALINMIIRFRFKNYHYQIAMRASFLGFAFSIGILIFYYGPMAWKSFGIYICFLSFFHYSEFLGIALSSPKSLSIDSFVLNHSVQYFIAAVSSWIEYLTELYFYPNMKEIRFFWIIGFLFCFGGEFLRKLAILTAKNNFNHLVQCVPSDDHQLITHGVYKYMRHPSYVGWFCWSIGTQIILFNPICIIFYTLVSWKFFHDRIFLEEITLLNFFGKEYHDYQQKVPTGLPFIYGYKI